ncbi:arabinose isomerase [Chitinophaga sp. SYP-B3965]|uniref:arabinose isomerase n=1 Tax=Chitinophaga sp. SYP-B3965 TaxID=2663120 RepID=UPI001299C628|nr:arabinose isomerase [Chitinophaga sp. SYP-B3965]MRG43688.1 arabinose isomerase [Chitinophaga sp. SYP-B3965]
MNIGLFGIGLEEYWSQFDGLQDRLTNNLLYIQQRLEKTHPHVLNLGLVDNTDKAFEAGAKLRTGDVDLIFIYVSTYALSSTVMTVLRNHRAPVVLLNLSPGNAINYDAFNKMNDTTQMTGEWLAYCSACPVPELANVFKRTGVRFHQITGVLQEDACWEEIGDWVAAAKVARTMNYNRLGCMGHYYSGMMDIYSDLTLQYKYFGGHMELLEVDELSALRREVSNKQAEERVHEFFQEFDMQLNCDPEEIKKAAITSVALDALTAKYKLGSMAYYYKGTGITENKETIATIIVGNSLLTSKGIPVAGEYEIKNAQAMKIMDSFGCGGSFSEYYAVDYTDDVVLLGHDGPAHIKIAQGKIKVKPLGVYHGKVGSGLSVEMSVKQGPVTLLSIVENDRNELFFLVAEAESVAGPILEIGNTNSRYRFSCGAKEFINRWNSHGPAHHCAIGTGHMYHKLEKLAKLLNMNIVKVC